MTIDGGRFDFNGGTFVPASGTTINITGGGTASLNTGLFFLPNNSAFSVTSGRLQLTGSTYISATASLLVSGSGASVVAGPGDTAIGVGGSLGPAAVATFTSGASGVFDVLEVGNSLGVGVLNVTDQNYKIAPLDLTRELPRSRMVTAALKCAF